MLITDIAVYLDFHLVHLRMSFRQKIQLDQVKCDVNLTQAENLHFYHSLHMRLKIEQQRLLFWHG
jgi:hypothetical protein